MPKHIHDPTAARAHGIVRARPTRPAPRGPRRPDRTATPRTPRTISDSTAARPAESAGKTRLRAAEVLATSDGPAAPPAAAPSSRDARIMRRRPAGPGAVRRPGPAKRPYVLQPVGGPGRPPRPRCSRQEIVLPVDRAVTHDPWRRHELVEVLEGIAVDDGEVGELPGFEATEITVDPEETGGDDGHVSPPPVGGAARSRTAPGGRLRCALRCAAGRRGRPVSPPGSPAADTVLRSMSAGRGGPGTEGRYGCRRG